MRRPDKRDRWLLASLAVLPFVWYATPIFTDAAYYVSDLMAQYNPWWTFGHESLRQGRLPLWNPYVLGGMPYHVNPENSLFYPLKLPLVFLSFFKAAPILRALDAVVASTGMYVLLRTLGTRRMSGWVGAVMFAYGSFMSYKFVHIPYVNTAVWFPWQLLLLDRLARRPRPFTCLLLAIVVAASFLGGSPGIFLICQLTLGLFLLFVVVRLAASRRWGRLTRLSGYLLLAAFLVVGLTLVLLAPAYQFAQLTPRAGGIADSPTFRDFVLTGEGLMALLFPFAHYDHGAPYPPLYPIFFLNVPFAGSAAVLLALFALASRRFLRLTPAALSIVTLSALLSMGTGTALLPWLARNVPVFGWFRWPHDYLLMTYLILPILAAAGLDCLLRSTPRQRRWFGVVTVAYLGLGLLWLRQPAALVALLVGGVIVGAGWLLARGEVAVLRLRPLGGALIIVCVLGELFLFGYGNRMYLPRDRVDPVRVDDALAFIQRRAGFDRVAVSAPGLGTHFLGQERIFNRYLPLLDGLPERHRASLDLDRWLREQRGSGQAVSSWSRRETFHNLDELFTDYPVNASMILGYQEVSGYDPFMIERVKTLYHTLPQQRSWDLLGVRYVVTPHRVAHDRLQPAFSGERMYVYENTTRYPRVMIPAEVEQEIPTEQILRRLGATDFDAAELALFEETLSESHASRVGRTATETAEIVDHEAERVVVLAQLERPGFVVLQDIYHPGWRAYVDGREIDVRRANYTFRAVHLPAGRHRVEFVYRPKLFYGAAWISAVCWLVCLTLAGAVALRSAERRPRVVRFEYAENPSL